jgi:hypothetical protein
LDNTQLSNAKTEASRLGVKQGDQMSFAKKAPKVLPNPFFDKIDA